MEVTLGEVCSFTNGGTPKKSVPEFWIGDIPFITGADIDEENGTITEPRGYITEEAISKSSTNLIPTESILLVTRTGVGKVAIPPYPVCVSQDFTALSFDPKVVHQRYLYHVLRSAKEVFVSRARGATIQGITREVVSSFKFDLPAYPEQERIAIILDKVNEIMQGVDCVVSQQENFIRSIFNYMFGDLVNNEMGWNQEPLGKHMNLINGRAYSKNELLNEGTPIIRIQNLKGGEKWYYSNLELPENKYCENGDLLFAWSATFGPFLWRGKRSIYHYHIWKIELESSVNKEFAYWLLDVLTLSIKNQSHGASMLHYGKGKMELLQIPIPPIERQIQFSRIIFHIQRMKLPEKLNHTKELVKSTLQEMLT